jgi:hypothetical protein
MATEAVSLSTVIEQSKAAGDERIFTPEVKALTRIADLLDCVRHELIALRTSIEALSD